MALYRNKCVRYITGLSLIGFGNTVQTRATECIAYHECNAAGSSSDEGAVKGGHGGLPPCGEVRRGKAPSETRTKAEINMEHIELSLDNRIKFGDSFQDKQMCFKFGMLIFGYVIAKCLYATGRRPFALPHRRNYVPAGHLPF